MRIFVSYKFSNVKDKEQLKQDLSDVSEVLESIGHKTFILARDIQNWNNKGHSMHSRFAIPAREIRKSDGVFVYITNNVFSPGLLFEIHFARLLGKKVIVAAKEGVNIRYVDKLATQKVIRFKNFSDLKDKINELK